MTWTIHLALAEQRWMPSIVMMSIALYRHHQQRSVYLKVVSLRDGNMQRGALWYQIIGAAVLPLHWIENGRCSCGKPFCNSPGKHPIAQVVPHGVKNASKDAATISEWWTAYPKANIGVATGRVSGVVVVDVDGEPGRQKLDALLAESCETLEAVWCVETGRVDGGRHFYFRCPTSRVVQSHRDAGLEIKSDGAYVVAPPSQHASGKIYTWTKTAEPLRELPTCFVTFANAKRKIDVARSYSRINHAGAASFAVVHNPPAWTQDEETRIRSALARVPADDRETWLRAGMALHWTGWGSA